MHHARGLDAATVLIDEGAGIVHRARGIRDFLEPFQRADVTRAACGAAVLRPHWCGCGYCRNDQPIFHIFIQRKPDASPALETVRMYGVTPCIAVMGEMP